MKSDTYQGSQIMLRCDCVQILLVEEAEDLPRLEQLEEALLVLLVVQALLEDDADDKFQFLLEVADVVTLHVLQNVVHYIQVDKLSLLLLYFIKHEKILKIEVSQPRLN